MVSRRFPGFEGTHGQHWSQHVSLNTMLSPNVGQGSDSGLTLLIHQETLSSVRRLAETIFLKYVTLSAEIAKIARKSSTGSPSGPLERTDGWNDFTLV